MFLLSPLELIGKNRLEKVRLEKNQLTGEPFNQSAIGTGEITEIDTGILFRSIGYRGIAITGVPFDERRGIFPNNDGRIIDDGNIVPQLYTAGWIKRGPTGIIGTNRADSVATVESLLNDLHNSTFDNAKNGADFLIPLLETRNVRYVTYPEWMKIDTVEIKQGQEKGKPREKFTRIEEMLNILD